MRRSNKFPLIYAVSAAENLLNYGADVSNAFAEAPPPKQGFYIHPDRAFREWWVHHKKRPPILEGEVFPILSAMQDIKDFYLNTPMARYEYMQLRIADMPEDVIEHYNLCDKATPDGYIYCEIQKGMYGLPQAGIIAQQLLEERLAKHGYRQSKTTPGLWKHDTRPISFTLVVDDLGVKYVGKENVQHCEDA